uniref:Uncharacterized protein n=1 Tax=Aegilops tauschii TaxID=37682 RepID=N1QXG2_AEGTA
MHTRDPGGHRLLAGTFVPMLDVSSMSMTFCPGHEYPINPIYLSVGNTTLFCLSESSFEMLHWEPLCPPPLGQRRSREWAWQRLGHPPFEKYTVTSYAVHPEACAIFVSTKRDEDIAAATFAFDTAKHTWERLGSWALPFAGRGHFDPHLNAFVGLSKDPGTLAKSTPAACPAPALATALSGSSARRSCSARTQLRGIKFCLVQCVSNSIEGESNGQELKEEEGIVGGPVCRTGEWGAHLELDEEGDVQELKEEEDEDEGYDQELMDEVQHESISLSLDSAGDFRIQGQCDLPLVSVFDES